jgi:uncharacterized protein DUF4169
MGDVVNLNKFRKAKNGDQREKTAAENRRKFGRTKSEKLGEKQKIERAKSELEGKKRDDTPID